MRLLLPPSPYIKPIYSPFNLLTMIRSKRLSGPIRTVILRLTDRPTDRMRPFSHDCPYNPLIRSGADDDSNRYLWIESLSRSTQRSRHHTRKATNQSTHLAPPDIEIKSFRHDPLSLSVLLRHAWKSDAVIPRHILIIYSLLNIYMNTHVE